MISTSESATLDFYDNSTDIASEFRFSEGFELAPIRSGIEVHLRVDQVPIVRLTTLTTEGKSQKAVRAAMSMKFLR